jgi:hypothetical protein
MRWMFSRVLMLSKESLFYFPASMMIQQLKSQGVAMTWV